MFSVKGAFSVVCNYKGKSIELSRIWWNAMSIFLKFSVTPRDAPQGVSGGPWSALRRDPLSFVKANLLHIGRTLILFEHGLIGKVIMRMLLIEDDRPLSESIDFTLSTKGFDCDISRLGKDGLETAKRYRYEIIVLDRKLPDMDGFDVLKKLRAAKVETPVLIISGLIGDNEKSEGLSLGADDFLAKPFSNYDLVARMQAIMWPCPRVRRNDNGAL